MRVRLLQHAAPAGRIRCWLGAIDAAAAASALLVAGGQQIVPVATQQASMRDHAVRAWWFEFPAAGDTTVVASIGGIEVARRTLRPAVPAEVRRDCHILLTSCFYKPNRDDGKIRNTLLQIRKHCGGAPDLTVLMGDQVYLDLPALQPFPDQLDWMRDRCAQAYIDNWFDGGAFNELLDSAPFLLIADDHELWNNAPESQVHIQNTWTASGRGHWRQAAEEAYACFRSLPLQVAADTPAPLSELRIGPAYLVLLDLRWLREERSGPTPWRARLSGLPGLYQALAAAMQRADQSGAVPLLVLGQGLFRDATHSQKDFEQADYADFAELCAATVPQPGASRESRRILLCGDVHFGRVAFARDRRAQDPLAGLYEAFVSPLALVSGIPVLQHLSVLKFWDRWPRHSAPDLAGFGPFHKHTGFESPEVLKARARNGSPRGGALLGPAGLQGDQMAVLSLLGSGDRPAAAIHYFSIDGKPDSGMTVPLFPRDLA